MAQGLPPIGAEVPPETFPPLPPIGGEVVDVADVRPVASHAPSDLDALPGAQGGLGLVATGQALPGAVRTAGRTVAFAGRHLPKIAGALGAGLGASLGASTGTGPFGVMGAASMGSMLGANTGRLVAPALQRTGQTLGAVGGVTPPAPTGAPPTASGAPSGPPVGPAAPAPAPAASRLIKTPAEFAADDFARQQTARAASQRGMQYAAGERPPGVPKAPSTPRVPKVPTPPISAASPGVRGAVVRGGQKALKFAGPLLQNLGVGLTVIDAIRNYDRYQEEKAAWEAAARRTYDHRLQGK